MVVVSVYLSPWSVFMFAVTRFGALAGRWSTLGCIRAASRIERK
jgi:hypothetical protein